MMQWLQKELKLFTLLILETIFKFNKLITKTTHSVETLLHCLIKRDVWIFKYLFKNNFYKFFVCLYISCLLIHMNGWEWLWRFYSQPKDGDRENSATKNVDFLHQRIVQNWAPNMSCAAQLSCHLLELLPIRIRLCPQHLCMHVKMKWMNKHFIEGENVFIQNLFKCIIIMKCLKTRDVNVIHNTVVIWVN